MAAKNAAADGTTDGASALEADTPTDRNAHAREMLEKENKATLITFEELLELGYGELCSWLKEIARFGNLERTMLFFRRPPVDGWDKPGVKAVFFTGEHRYAIHAHIGRQPDGYGYVGCVACARKPRPGETWTRGNDLPDGPYVRKTFDRIVQRIVSYEMKNLQCWS